MTTPPMASPTKPVGPLKVDVLQLMFFLLGAPHIYGALRSNQTQKLGGSLPSYFYLVPLAAIVAGGVEFWLM